MSIKRIFFNDKSRGHTDEAFNRIIIRSGSERVVGLLSNKFSIGLQASWDNIASMDGALGLLGKGMGLAGYSVFNAGIWTRKYYKGGSYLTINPSFKVVDWDGTGAVLIAAQRLLRKTVPSWVSGNDNNSKTRDTILPKNGVTAENVGIKAKASSNALSTGLDALKSLGSTLSNYSLTRSPHTVSVTISNYFSHIDMIIENVSVEFSEEMTENGPMSGDFSVTLSTIEATTSDSIGLKKPFPASRVTRE